MADDAKLTAFDGAPGDNFGYSVSLSGNGNTALVGSYLDDDKGSSSGSAYVYQATESGWSVTKLVAPDGASGDYFGYSVSLSHDGGTALIGAYFDDAPASNSGSAYVYRSTGNGWEVAKLTAPDGAAGDAFGYSVALSDDGRTAVIGARLDDDKGLNSGSAYVYHQTDAGWSATKLTASDGAASDLFGHSVAVSADGHTTLIGAYLDDDKGTNSGSAYLYRETGSGWVATKLVAHDGASGDNFGYSVALSNDGNTALVGSYMDDDKGSNSGSAYVYRWTGSSWTETKLVARDGAAGDSFGYSVSLSDDGSTAIVGARFDDDKGSNSGSTYVYHWNGSAWDSVKLVAADGAATDYFGHAVAVSGDGETALIGARFDDDKGLNSGSAYVLEIARNAAPVSLQDQFTTTEDSRLVSSLVVDDGSEEDDTGTVVDTQPSVTFALSADPAKQPTHGSIVVNADGTYIYTPNAAQQALGDGEKATDSFTVLVKDAQGATTEQTVTVTITGLNDAPVVSVVDPAATREGNAGHSDPVAIDLFRDLTTASDVDRTDRPAYKADSISVAAASGSATGDIGLIAVDQATGQVSYDRAAFDFLAAGQKAVYTIGFDVQSGPDVVQKTVTLTINGENDAPTVLAGLVAEADEGDSALTLDLLKGASDVDAGAVLSVQGLPAGLPAGLSLAADGHTLVIDPNHASFDSLAFGDQHVLTFDYLIGDGVSAVKQTASITVHGVNDGPEVSDSVAAVGTEGTDRLTVNLLEHAADVDAGETATLSISGLDPATLPAGFTLSSDGKSLVIDTNHSAFEGLGAGETATTTLTYNVVDVHGAAVAQTATITIVGVNDAPIVSVVNPAVGAEGDMGHSDPVAIDLFNDLTTASDPDRTDHPAYKADSISVAAASGSATGDIGLIAVDQATGQVSYDRAAFDFLAAGQKAVYTIGFDVQSGSDVVHKTVTLTVDGENDAPTVTAGLSAEANEGGSAFSLDLLQGASDVDAGAVLSISGLPAGLPAGLSLAADGHTLVIDPTNPVFNHLAEGEQQVLALDYLVSDGMRAVKQSARIAIHGVNDGPEVSEAVAETGREGADPFKVNLLEHATDVDTGETATLSISGLDPATLPAGFTLSSDGKSLLVDARNAAYDGLGAGETATTTLTYNVVDVHGASIAQTATITIVGVNDAPIVSVVNPAATTEGDAGRSDPVTIDLFNDLTTASDVDRTDHPAYKADSVSVAAASGSATGDIGLIAVDQATGKIGYDRAAFDFLGAGRQALYTIGFDVQSGSDVVHKTVTLAIKGENDGPTVAAGLAVEAQEGDSALRLDLLKGASDVDAGAVLSVEGLPDRLPAGLRLAADGHTLVIDPGHAAFDSLAAGETSKLALNYSVADEHGAAVAQTAVITIVGENDGPTANGDSAGTDENTAVSVNVLANDRDPDATDVLTLSGARISSGLGSVSIASDGKSIQYDPTGKYDYLAAGEHAAVGVRYDVSDGHGGVASALATITITGVNDGPVARADSGVVLEDQSVFLDILKNDSDIDSDPLSIVSVFSSSGTGKSALGASIAIENGTVHYTADADSFDLLVAGSSVVDTFSYAISDHHGGTSTATVSVTVKGDADAAPVYLGNGADAFTDTGERDSIVFGENGDDRLNGMGGADQLHGGNGADRLDGGNGSDTLFGDRGDDWLTGGKGADTFVFAKSGGADTITDFQIGVDHLRLDDGLTMSAASSADVDHNGVIDTVLQFSNGSVTLLNTGPAAAQDHFFV